MKQITIPLLTATGLITECIISYPLKPPWFIKFTNSNFSDKIFNGDDLFNCLCDLRIFLEQYNTRILCNGARIDTYPSSLLRGMGGARKVYILAMGKQATQSVGIFDATNPEKIGTVQEQFSFYRKWLESLQMPNPTLLS